MVPESGKDQPEERAAESAVADSCSGRRERKKNVTREALRAAALALVCERGLDHVTVEAIADAADVSPRTFFNYFSSKEEAVASPDQTKTELLVSALREAGPSSALDALHAACRQYVSCFGPRRKEWAQRIVMLRSHPSLYLSFLDGFARTERALAAAVAERAGLEANAGAWPRLAAAAACAAMRVAVEQWADGRGDLQELLDAAFSQLRSGFTTVVLADGSQRAV